MKSRNGQKKQKDVKQAWDELAGPPSKPKQKTKILNPFIGLTPLSHESSNKNIYPITALHRKGLIWQGKAALFI